MAEMEWNETAAERLEAVYLGPDVIAQREDTLSGLGISSGERVLDIGSGPGFLAEGLADRTGPSGSVVGVDISELMVRRATSRAQRTWLSFEQADATSLPFHDSSFDVVVSTQVAEYVHDIDTFCSELTRALKPNGHGIILATDWDAICWHSSDPERMDKVLKAFAPHCADSRLPRTLGPRLRKAKLEVTKVSYFPIVNFGRYEGCYSEMVVPLISTYIKDAGTIPDAVLAAWADDLDRLDARGEYFFSTGRFSFHIRKPE